MPAFRWSGRWSGWGLLLLLALAWQASAQVANSLSWPPFSEVASAFAGGVAGGELPAVLGSTLWRLLRGFAIGSFVGLALGVLMSVSPLMRRTLLPSCELLRPIPISAMIPPLVFLLGVGDVLRISVIALTAFFPVVINTMSGIAGIDPVHRQMARTFGLSRAAELRHVIIPAAMPYVLAGMRTSLGLALVATVVAEMLVGSDGIGQHLLLMQFALRSADMYAALIALAAMGYALNALFLAIENRLIHWSRTGDAGGSVV
ncbi:MAG: ABC transporter permease [Burkholderiaceae bacterium]